LYANEHNASLLYTEALGGNDKTAEIDNETRYLGDDYSVDC